jgi:hypothetical protein
LRENTPKGRSNGRVSEVSRAGPRRGIILKPPGRGTGPESAFVEDGDVGPGAVVIAEGTGRPELEVAVGSTGRDPEGAVVIVGAVNPEQMFVM